ncbi:MAG: hypothetical protein ACLGH1_11665 [Gammaproteobacteria bacterium]
MTDKTDNPAAGFRLPEHILQGLAKFRADNPAAGWGGKQDEQKDSRSLPELIAETERARRISIAEEEERARLRVREEWERSKHQPEATETPMKRAAIIERLGRRYPALASALDRPEEWAKACRVTDRHGWYYLERIEAECRARYGGAAPAPAADLSPAGQLRSIGR